MSARRTLAGFHAVSARLRAAPDSIECIYVDARRRDGRMQRLREQADAAAVEVVAADPGQLRALCGEAPHQGVVAVAADIAQVLTLDDVLEAQRPDTLLLLLDSVTDPRNLGACLRVADAAGVDAVIAPRDRSAGMTPAALKAAAGAAESVPLIEVTNLARALEAIDEAGGLGSRCRRRGLATADTRALRGTGADSAARHRGESQRVRRDRDLPVRDCAPASC
jgi:23S rRNA (guanosine2251-2'-O)-methyltransferase